MLAMAVLAMIAFVPYIMVEGKTAFWVALGLIMGAALVLARVCDRRYRTRKMDWETAGG